jgi:hypothetical protein
MSQVFRKMAIDIFINGVFGLSGIYNNHVLRRQRAGE